LSRPIHEILRHYRELEPENPGSEILEIKADIDRALIHADLDPEEREAIGALFLADPPSLSRTEKSGRPKGSATQEYISYLQTKEHKSDNAWNIIVSRRIRSACEKLQQFLGDEYKA
jgi:hypothetical protein